MTRMTDFDPYDMLVALNDRLTRVEAVHNRLAISYNQTEQEFNIALHSLKQLQEHHARLSSLVNRTLLDDNYKQAIAREYHPKP